MKKEERLTVAEGGSPLGRKVVAEVPLKVLGGTGRGGLADFYGHFGLAEGMGYVSEAAPVGEDPQVAFRWSQKVRGHYNRALNVSLEVKESSIVRGFGVSDGLLLVRPDLKGYVRNEDFVLMHECAHEKQRILLGFGSRAEMVDSFTDDLSASELGARDWVEKYTMPPFVMSEGQREAVFSYYGSRDLRKSVAMGLRDIHSDVIALRERDKIFIDDAERKRELKPGDKFLAQFKDELAANARELESDDPKSVLERIRTDTDRNFQPDLLRKAARFAAVAGGAEEVLEDGKYGEIASSFDRNIAAIFGAGSREYRAYSSLTAAYRSYFINCTRRTDLIDHSLLSAALESPQTSMRARAADFLGEVGDIRTLGPLVSRLTREDDEHVRPYLAGGICDVLKDNLDSDEAVDAVRLVFAVEDEYASGRAIGLLREVPANRVGDYLRMASSLSYNETQGGMRAGLGSVLHNEGVSGCLFGEMAAKNPDAAVKVFNDIVDGWIEQDRKGSPPAEADYGRHVLSVWMNSALFRGLCKTRPDETLDIVEKKITNRPQGTDLLLDLCHVGDVGGERPERALGILKEHLDVPDGNLRTHVVAAIADLGPNLPDQVIDILEEYAEDRGTFRGLTGRTYPVGDVALRGMIVMWNLRPERVGRVVREWAGSKDPYHKWEIANVLAKVMGAANKLEKYPLDSASLDDRIPAKEVLDARPDEILDIAESLMDDESEEVKHCVAEILSEVASRRPKRVFDILQGKVGERDPAVLKLIISSVGNLAGVDAGRSLVLLKELMQKNPWMPCNGGLQQSAAYAVSEISGHGADPDELIDLLGGWERAMTETFSPGNEATVESMMKKAKSGEHKEDDWEGPRYTTRHMMETAMNFAYMHGAIKPLSDPFAPPKDKLGLIRVETSVAYANAIAGIIVKHPETYEHGTNVMRQMLHEREFQVIVGLIPAIGRVGHINPKDSSGILVDLVGLGVAPITERAMRALNQFADKIPDVAFKVAIEHSNHEQEGIRKVAAQMLGKSVGVDPEAAYNKLVEIACMKEPEVSEAAAYALLEAFPAGIARKALNNTHLSTAARKVLTPQNPR